MNKLVKWTLGMMMPAVAALAVCLMLMPAADATAAGNCFCFGMNQTKTFTGVSSQDCPWARMDALHQAHAWASCGVDGFCVEQYQELGCALPSAPFNFGLVFTWKCQICI